MATLTIGDKNVTIDDGFLQLPPDQQQAAVEHIAGQLGFSANSARPSLPSTIPASAENLKGIQKAPDGEYYVKGQNGDGYLKLQRGEGGNMLVPAAGDPFEGKSLNDALSAGAVRFKDLSPDQQDRVASYNGTTADNIGRGLARGVPFLGPWMNSASAKMNAALGGYAGGSQAPDYKKRVEDNLAYENARDRVFDKQSPVLSTAAQIGGGVAGTIAAAPEIAATSAVEAAPSVVNAIRNFALGTGAKSIPGAIGRGAVAGAAQGANAGIASDGTAGTAAKDALLGAGLGAGISGVLGGLGVGARVAYNKFTGANKVPSILDDMSPAARKYASEITPAEAVPKLQSDLAALGPDATLADVSPEWRGVASGVHADPKARGIIAEPLTARDTGKNTRLADDLNQSIGPAEDPEAVNDAIIAHRQARDTANYGAVHKNAPPVDVSDTIDLIQNLKKNSSGNTLKALQNAEQSLLETAEVPVLRDDGTPILARKNVRSAPQEESAQPVELRKFIKGLGGINDEDGELRDMGLKALHNPKGLSLDKARELAAEAGYLGGDTEHAVSNTYTSDLLDALGSEKPVYNVHDMRDFSTGYGKGNAGGWVQDVGAPLKQTTQIPVTNSEKLHNIRMDLDKALSDEVPSLGVQPGALGKQNAAILKVRQSLDKNLKQQVPGMSEADALSAQMADRANALKMGVPILTKQPNPVTFAATHAAMEPGAQVALAKGTRGAIDRVAGTSLNDPVALARLVKGEGDWNRQNLETIFGSAPAQKALGAIDREKRFRDTFNTVTGNSETAARRQFHETAKLVEDSSMIPKIPVHHTMYGAVAKAINKMTSVLGTNMGKERAAAFMADLGRKAIAQGLTRDEFLAALHANGVNHNLANRLANMAAQGGMLSVRLGPASDTQQKRR